MQEAPPKPSRCVGVGNYDVTVEYVTEAEAYHTMSEQVQRIKEKEIQAWIEGEFNISLNVGKTGRHLFN